MRDGALLHRKSREGANDEMQETDCSSECKLTPEFYSIEF